METVADMKRMFIALAAALLLSAAPPACACDYPWKVYQSGVSLCCSFATLHDAQEFVAMNAGNGNDYVIVRECKED